MCIHLTVLKQPKSLKYGDSVLLFKHRSSCSEIGSACDLYSCSSCCERLESETSSASLGGSEFASIFWAFKCTANKTDNEIKLDFNAWGFFCHWLPRTREVGNYSPSSRSLITFDLGLFTVADEDQAVREEFSESNGTEKFLGDLQHLRKAAKPARPPLWAIHTSSCMVENQD